MNDELIEGLKKQDIKYLNKFIKKYGNLIYGVINGILDKSHEKELIDECFDDILLNIWYNIDCYDCKKANFTSWLISVSKFKAIDYKRKSNKTYNLCNISDLNLEDKNRVDEELKLEEQSKELMDLISELHEKDREIFIRKYLNEESIENISKSLKIPKENIYNRLSRGRKKLKSLMEGRAYER
ncbi:sigma-70 family RNA polymerase sigma factor [Clostridium ganghwense]|uniref:Sigma-70 family RNA polymerase sigma factor n=1 Tax=Clostridium ganghwense TaxID=312089 RepID=A0ABT4CQ29_9CLOT|nr:sigma-70 family RNA polymerase sigma factor [Clostridium ganghwense]MCY6371168.1 sigma-70 family RNA polymerase sigma factor [Clostridium ganghwense]